jgi:hypothetical protein
MPVKRNNMINSLSFEYTIYSYSNIKAFEVLDVEYWWNLNQFDNLVWKDERYFIKPRTMFKYLSYQEKNLYIKRRFNNKC